MMKASKSRMSRRIRLLLYIAAGLAVLVLLALLGLYFALRHEPAFYARAMQIAPPVLERGSDRMIRQATALQNATARSGRWQAVITAEEMNGWLTVDMMKNHPGTLPPGFSDPRVAIDSNRITVGCRFQQSGINSVLSLAVRPYMAEPNVLALRIEQARVGALPLPLEQILKRVSQAARDMQWQLEWRHTGGDPVAMLTLPDDAESNHIVRIESFQLAEGEIRIIGNTQRRKR